MQSSFYNLKTYLYWQNHYDITNSSVQVYIIGKSFDKLVKARDVKVSTKRWRDRSQTQRYGGSGTGYHDVSHKLPILKH